MSSKLFTITKKSGLSDRYAFNSIIVDEYLTAQELRDVYFQLIGKSDKVGQKTTSKFPRKDDLITECQRLIRLYDATPSEWSKVLQEQSEREARLQRKAKINECILKFESTETDELEIMQIAIRTILNKRNTASSASSSESD